MEKTKQQSQEAKRDNKELLALIRGYQLWWCHTALHMFTIESIYVI